MSSNSPLYRIAHESNADLPLRQGEIVSNAIMLRRVWDEQAVAAEKYNEVTISLAIVLTQDCDLEQDYRKRFPDLQSTSDKLIPSVLLGIVTYADDTFARIAQSNKKLWERLNIASNTNPRFHFLQAVEKQHDRVGEGLPELTIDFKNYFTIPTQDLYHDVRIEQTQRRSVLVSPYLEHLSHRFAYYIARVGLPEDHLSE